MNSFNILLNFRSMWLLNTIELGFESLVALNHPSFWPPNFGLNALRFRMPMFGHLLRSWKHDQVVSKNYSSRQRIYYLQIGISGRNAKLVSPPKCSTWQNGLLSKKHKFLYLLFCAILIKYGSKLFLLNGAFYLPDVCQLRSQCSFKFLNVIFFHQFVANLP